MPSIFTRKPGSAGGGKHEKASTLIKPRVSAGAEGGSGEKTLRKDEPAKDAIPSEKTEQKDSTLVKPVREAESRGATDSRGTVPPAGKRTFGGPESPKSVEERLASGTEPGEGGDNGAGSFKKHDHLQYVQLIEKKALEIVKKHREATLVRVCKDTTTDQWTMNIYSKDAKGYSFTSYAWDEVDEKWEESFESRRQPIKRWKSHLDFSAARKTCKVLKGTLD